MSTLQQTHDIDLESGNYDGGGGDSGGGGGKNQSSGGDGGGRPCSGDGNEIIRVSENHSANIKEKDERRESNVSESSVEIGDLESETKLHSAKIERDCRICHMSMDATNQDCGVPIELGCSCKDDLAAAHKQCAEAWFKIKGNRTCEICGSIATNVTVVNEAESTGEQWDESNDATSTAMGPPPVSESSRNFWQGHRFLNFLLACMVFAFVISWLFHFNVPS